MDAEENIGQMMPWQSKASVLLTTMLFFTTERFQVRFFTVGVPVKLTSISIPNHHFTAIKQGLKDNSVSLWLLQSAFW